MRPILAALSLTLFAAPAAAETLATAAGPMTARAVVTGLEEPWAVDWLPDNTIVITERGGRIMAVRDGVATEVTGGPRAVVDGQGGLLDILVPRDFAQSGEVFLTYAKRQGLRGSGTAVYRARLDTHDMRLRGGRAIFEIAGGTFGGYHFGSRLAEAPDGTLFLTVGDRTQDDSAQDLATHNGKVLRIDRDGNAPADNPFAGTDGALPEIWSYGHRNPQGLAFDGDGRLWAVEHGAAGGDEVNLIEPGTNYGWPVISYGTQYSGAPIGEGTAKPGMAQPVHYWDPSMAPSGLAFYDGIVADWRGDAFVGSLKFDYIARLSGDPLAEVERIAGDATWRVRDVRQGPDGALWFLSVGNGALYRLAPAPES